jgi:hypothetical protein
MGYAKLLIQLTDIILVSCTSFPASARLKKLLQMGPSFHVDHHA